MIGIEIQNLSFSYINQSIFSNVSTKFVAGEKIRLTGDNGAGKTTLLKLVCSVLKPQAGQISYLEDKFDHDQNSVRKITGVSLDDSHLLRHFTVTENLRFYQKLYTSTTSFEKIAPWLDRFKLQTYRETPIQYLSQGEQKKVSLIKAFLHNPEVLILDEPTNSLDHESKLVLSDILQSLDASKLVLVSTHDHAWSQSWSNKEIKIQGGKIL